MTPVLHTVLFYLGHTWAPRPAPTRSEATRVTPRKFLAHISLACGRCQPNFMDDVSADGSIKLYIARAAPDRKRDATRDGVLASCLAGGRTACRALDAGSITRSDYRRRNGWLSSASTLVALLLFTSHL